MSNEREIEMVRLFWIMDTDKAHGYQKTDPTKQDLNSPTDQIIWVPKSLVEHRTKRGNYHEVTLPSWWVEENL